MLTSQKQTWKVPCFIAGKYQAGKDETLQI